MTITIDSKSTLSFLIYLMATLAGSEYLGYFQTLGIGTPNKIIAALGIVGAFVQAASFAWGLKKPATPPVA